MAPYFHLLGSTVCWSNTLELVCEVFQMEDIYVGYEPATQHKVFGLQESEVNDPDV